MILDGQAPRHVECIFFHRPVGSSERLHGSPLDVLSASSRLLAKKIKKALNRVRMAMEWKNTNHFWDILQPWSMTARVIEDSAKSGHLHVPRKPKTNGLAGFVHQHGVVCSGNHEAQLRLLIDTAERSCLSRVNTR